MSRVPFRGQTRHERTFLRKGRPILPTNPLVMAWLVVSGVTVAVLLTPFVVPDELICSVARQCEAGGGHQAPCALCGMTTAFLLISEGRLGEALAANRWSLGLYVALILNVTGAALVVRQLVAGRLLAARGARFRWVRSRRASHRF